MIGLGISGSVSRSFAGWRLALLVVEGVQTRLAGTELEAELERVETALKARFGSRSRKELALLEPMRAYAEYFATSGKAYPVLLQVESIASKGRRLATPDPLVGAMFAAELEGQLLTAGHDLDALRPPLALRLASGTELMPTFGGGDKAPPEGDLVMRDAAGIVASVLLGPDSRTCISPRSSRLLFAVYAPPAVSAARIESQLERLFGLAALACPGARRGESSVVELG